MGAKHAYGGGTRTDMYLMDPTALTIVTDNKHPLYDGKRVHLPVSESVVRSMRRSSFWAHKAILARSVVVSEDMQKLSIVRFRDEKIVGMFRQSDQNVLLARKELRHWSHALATLVHEFSHRAGGDGEHGHVAAMEEMWRKIAVVAMEVRGS